MIISFFTHISLTLSFCSLISSVGAQPGSTPFIKSVYEDEESLKIEISLPDSKASVVPGSKGKVYYLDDFDNTPSYVADIFVINITEDGIAHARVTGKSHTEEIKEGYFVNFVPGIYPENLIDKPIQEESEHTVEHSKKEEEKKINIKTKVFETTLYESIAYKIIEAKCLCELNKIDKDHIQRFIQDYQDSKYVSILKSRLDEKRMELKRKDQATFKTMKQEIDQADQIKDVREIATRFHEENPCSDYSGDIDKYVKLRIEAINRIITNYYELLSREINEAGNFNQLTAIQEKVNKFKEDYPNNENISRLEKQLQKKRSILLAESPVQSAPKPPDSNIYLDYKSNIKNVVYEINNAIRTGKVSKFYQFLTKENDVFYSRERRIMEDFAKEIQVLNSSFDDVNININGNTANVQYLWNMDFKWKAYYDKRFKNNCIVSLRLKKNGSDWEIFDARILSR